MRIPLFLQITEAGTAVSGEEIEQTVQTLSIWELIVNAGWYIMIPLAILSFVAVYIFVERFFAIRRAVATEKDFLNRVKDFISDGRIDAAKTMCDSSNTPIGRMLGKGISRIGKPIDDIRGAIENVGKLEIYRLEKGLSTLATVAGAAPMIGFLGTVIGMIVTFHNMAISGSGVKIDALSGGIMQAMVTTVAGLIIGIVAYVSYNMLVSRVDKIVHKMEQSSIEFLDVLHGPGK